MTGTPRPIALPGLPEPLWLTEPATGSTAVVVFVHAPGENFTGNNYLFRDLADGCVRANMAAARFDLPGCGESREPLDLAAWDKRIREVRAAIASWRADVVVHWVARGLSTALLPLEERGLRVALSPPAPQTLLPLLPADSGVLRSEPPLSSADTALWTAVGAEPNLVGGARLPADMVRTLAGRLTPDRFDVAVAARTAEHAGPVLRMSTTDPLFRFEADRAALSVLLPQRLREWYRWRPDGS